MNDDNLRHDIYNLFRMAKLHSWCAQVDDEIDEIKKIKNIKEKAIVKEIALDKINSKRKQSEELILAFILLFFISFDHHKLIDFLFNKIKNRLFSTDFDFLMKQLYDDQSPLPKDLTYDLTTRVFVDIRDAIKKALMIREVISTLDKDKTVLFFILLLCRPDLNEENKAMLYLLLARVKAYKPANLEKEAINFFKKVKIVDKKQEIEKDKEAASKSNDAVPKKMDKKELKDVLLKDVTEKSIEIIGGNKNIKSSPNLDSKKNTVIDNIKMNFKTAPFLTRKSKTNGLSNNIREKNNNVKKQFLDTRNKQSSNKQSIETSLHSNKKDKFIVNDSRNKMKNQKDNAEEALSNIQKIEIIKKMITLFFGPLSFFIKSIIDRLLNKTPEKKINDLEIKKQNKNINIKSKSVKKINKNELKEEKDKKLLKLSTDKQPIKMFPLLKYLLISIPIILMALFFSDSKRFNQLQKSSQNLKDKIVILKKHSPYNQMLKNSKSHILIKEANGNSYWYVKKNDNIWNLYKIYKKSQIQNNQLKEIESWPAFLNNIQKMNNNKNDLDLIFPDEKILIPTK